MSRRCLSVVVASVIMLGLTLPSATLARQPPTLLRRPEPAPRLQPDYATHQHLWHAYGLDAPTFRWGYFGARSRPSFSVHRGYYGKYKQWTCRHGY